MANETLIMPQANIYTVRHAESLQNVADNFTRNTQLSELGKQQATQTGILLATMLGETVPAAIIHTGLTRTSETAQLMQRSSGFSSPLMEMPEFREREMGDYDQITMTDFIKRNPHMTEYYNQHGSSCIWFFDDTKAGVEPISFMKDRIFEGILKIHQTYNNQPIILVAHAGSIKMLRLLYEMPHDTHIQTYLSSYVPKNCEIYKIL